MVCMMLGMVLKSCAAPHGGAARSASAAGRRWTPSGGHHLMTCNKTAALNAAHTRLQESVSVFSQIPYTTRVASTRATGFPHEKPVRGKKAAVTTVHAPTLHGPRHHEREGVSALALAAEGGDVRCSAKSVEQRRGESSLASAQS